MSGREDWRFLSLVRESILLARSQPVRAVLVTGILAAVFGALAAMDISAGTGAVRGYRDWLRQGGNVVVVSVQGARLDAARCSALATLPHVVSAGALARSGTVHPRSAPGVPVQSGEVTAGLVPIISAGRETAVGDVLVGRGLAVELALRPGSWLAVDERAYRVGTVVDTDDRAPGLSRWLLRVRPPVGAADECWVEFAPGQLTAGARSLPAWFGSTARVDVTPISERVGGQEPVQRWAERPQRYGWAAAALLVATVLGLVAWTRRSAMALYLVTGTSRTSLLLLQLLELHLVVLAAAALGLLWAAAGLAAVDGLELAPFLHALRAVALAALAGLVVGGLQGTVAGGNLFQRLKDRQS